jgi:hypothetical protein
VGHTLSKRTRKAPKAGAKHDEYDHRRLDFTDFEPDPGLEDEFFGGFASKVSDHDDGLVWRETPFRIRSCSRRACGGYLGCPCRGDFRDPTQPSPTWGRIWRLRPGQPRRWAAETLWGLTDGQTPEMYQRLVAAGHWRKWRKIPPQRAEGNRVNFPFALQAVRQAEQKLPVVTPEQDRAEWLERLEWRESLLDKSISPDEGPAEFYARGILHVERAAFLAQHVERAIQKAWRRRYKPSTALEAKRMPKLKRVAANPLLTRDYLSRGFRYVKDAAWTECQTLVAQFLAAGGVIRACPPEKLAAQVGARAPKMGRPPLTGRAMTGRERIARYRAKNKNARCPAGVIGSVPSTLSLELAVPGRPSLRVLVTPPQPKEDTNVRTAVGQHQFNPGRLDRGRKDHAKRKAAP